MIIIRRGSPAAPKPARSKPTVDDLVQARQQLVTLIRTHGHLDHAAALALICRQIHTSNLRGARS